MTDLQPSLVPADYVDPAVYAHEVERVLAASWLPLCRADQIPSPGDRYAVTLAGRPVMAVRDKDHTIRVLANVCPHRGSIIAEAGAGHDSALVCPYHRWAFRLDGSLVGAPLAEGADLGDACLPAIRSTVWEGFVLANLGGTAESPEHALAGLSAHLAPWRWDEMVTVASMPYESAWNWKVMVENWIECYHHIGTHRDTVEPIQPARTTKVISCDGAPWAAMTVDTDPLVVGEPDTWMPGLSADDARLLSVWSAFPLLLGGAISHYGFWLHVLPVDATRHTVTWHLLAHRDQLDRFPPDEVRGIMEVLALVHAEDMAACTRVQTGLTSGQIDRFRLAPLEATIADFQRWVAAARHA